MPILVKENSSTTLTKHQVRFDIGHESGMKPDFSDIRFTLADGETLIDFWIERYTASAKATVWVEIPELTADAVTSLYLYYNNEAANSASNGTNTFVFFDDFSSWQGWLNYGPGSVAQNTTAFSTDTVLSKTSSCDPNGGYKLIGETLDNFRLISREIRVTDGVSGCSWNRYGIENEDFNGYNIRRDADQTANSRKFGYERRNNGSASNINDSNMNHPRDKWYRTELKRCSGSNTLDASLYSDDRTLIGKVTGNDSAYEKFDRITVRGGIDYYIDVMAVANYTCNVPSYSYGAIETDLPSAVCQNISKELDADGNITIDATEIDNGSYDECGIQSMTLDNSVFICSDIGLNLVTLTVTDLHGNTATCIAEVTISDQLSPIIPCPSNITIDANTSNCEAIVNWSMPNITDNCEVDQISQSHESGDTFPLGVTSVAYKAVDISGNTNSCSFTVTVTNPLADPTISITENSGLNTNDAVICNGDAVVLSASAGYDTYSWSNGGNGQSVNIETAGIYTVIVSNANGCTKTVSQTVIVKDLPNAGTCNLIHDLCMNNEGQISIKASEGLAPYTVSWTPAIGNANSNTITNSGDQITINDIPGGTTINITVTDANGCSIN